MAKYDEMSFSKAFAAARKEKGAGNTFTYKGKSYSTNYKEEASAPSKKKTDIAQMASDAIDRSGPTRPKSRPTGTRPRSRPVDRAATATSVTTPEVTTEKLPPSSSVGAKPTANQTSPNNPPQGVPAKTWRQMTPRERVGYFMDKLRIGKGGLSERPRNSATQGMAKGGLVKANCGASMKPTQKSTSKK